MAADGELVLRLASVWQPELWLLQLPVPPMVMVRAITATVLAITVRDTDITVRGTIAPLTMGVTTPDRDMRGVVLVTVGAAARGAVGSTGHTDTGD